MTIHIVKTPISEKYEMIPIMLCNEIGETYERINIKDVVESPYYVWHYNSTIRPKFSLRPNHNAAMKWDSKIYQYKTLFGLVNVPNYEVWQTSLELIKNLQSTKQKYKEFLITTEFGEGGKSFMYCDKNTHPEDIFKRFGMRKIRVSNYISNAESFSLHCIIANETSFYVSPVVKQHITEKTIFRGCKYPCDKPNGINQMCEVICKEMYNDGYIGMFHLDIMVADGELYFCEINPRMAASTPFMVYTLELEEDVILPYVEYRAIVTGDLPLTQIKIGGKVHWDFKIFDGEIPDITKQITHAEIRNQFKQPNELHYVDLFDGRYMEVQINDT